jgi:hypothetical protein
MTCHASRSLRREAPSLRTASRSVDEEHRSKESDQGPDRHVSDRAPVTHDEDPKHDDCAHDLRQGQRDERAFPPERRPQHRAELDIAPAHASAADDGDEEYHAPAYQRAERRIDEGRTSLRDGSQAKRVSQPRQRDQIGDPASLQIKDDDHRHCSEQRQELPPPRGNAKSVKGKQREPEGQSRTEPERGRPNDLAESALYFVDDGPVGAGPGIKRGAG